MDRDELTAWLRLTLTPGVGNDSARRLLACFGTPATLFRQDTTALQQVVSRAQATALTGVVAFGLFWMARRSIRHELEG